MVQGEGPQGRPGSAGAGAPEAPPRAARSAARPAGLGRRLAGGGGKRGAAPTGGTPVAADGSPLTPPGGRRGCALGPCGRQGRKRPPAEPGQGDHSPSSPMNSRMREPCGMSSAPMGKKWR